MSADEVIPLNIEIATLQHSSLAMTSFNKFMFTIICGEDTISSRNYFNSLKQQYKTKGFENINVLFNNLSELALINNPSLFSERKAFFIDNLSKKYKKSEVQLTKILQTIEKSKEIFLFDWEEVSGWELKIKKIGQVKEFKPKDSIFKLQDSVYPCNKITFLNILNSLSSDENENFIFVMLVRHIRNLILVKEGVIPQKMQSWQVAKLRGQAGFWKRENLINFYKALLKVEISIKSGSTPFDFKQSLDILAYHFF